jgi:hypothetical protein
VGVDTFKQFSDRAVTRFRAAWFFQSLPHLQSFLTPPALLAGLVALVVQQNLRFSTWLLLAELHLSGTTQYPFCLLWVTHSW